MPELTSIYKVLFFRLLECQIRVIVALLLIATPYFLLSQTEIKGKFPIHNFGKVKSGMGPQNWQIELLENGKLVIANNGGLVLYDGVHWDLYPLPNKTIVRSLCIVDQAMIFVGGQDEVGFFDSKFKYHSIRDMIPDQHLPLEDVWQIVAQDRTIYFRSVDKVFRYNIETKKIKVVSTGNTLISIVKMENQIYFHDLFSGLRSFNNPTNIFPGSEALKYIQLLNIVNFAGIKLGITESHGLFVFEESSVKPFNEDLNSYLIKNKLFNASTINGSSLLLGTQFDGIISIDTSGKINETFNKAQGLSNNSINTLMLDRNKDLWVGTSNGLSEIQINSPITSIQPDQAESSSFYDVQEYDDDHYFASNTGIYKSTTDGNFQLVQNTSGQAWGLDTVSGLLLAGHNQGPFIVNPTYGELLSGIPGAWKFISTSKGDHIYVGTYKGVDIYKKQGGKFSFLKKLEAFDESSRIMISVKPQEIWVSHPYRGVFRITHNTNFNDVVVKTYNNTNGLPSELLNYLFEINGKPYVTGQRGIFYFDRDIDRFVPDPELNAIIDSTQNVRRLFQDPMGHIWFVAENEVGVLRKTPDNQYTKQVFPQLLDKFVGGFEQMSFSDDGRVFICTDEDVLIFDQQHLQQNEVPIVNFHEIRLIEKYDSLLLDQDPVLKHDQNAIRFSYSNPEDAKGVMYQYNLNTDGNDHLSHWTTETQKEFNNLSAGKYTFTVKSKTLQNQESEISQYAFEILAPWYLSVYARIIYGLLLLAGFLSIVLVPRKKYKKDKEILIEAKNQSDEELEKVKTEKLNAELASSTMHLVQKNESMHKIKAQLDEFRKKIVDPTLKKELKKVISVVDGDARLEDDWERFSTHFDQVHTHFLSRLTVEYPQITPKDRKLCAYLRMNLSTKEIAPLMHISVRGVEISRYRLRKKLGLPTAMNLNDFMMHY